MRIRTELFSMMAAGAFLCLGAFADDAVKPAAKGEVPDCCKPDFLKEPAAAETAKPAEAAKPNDMAKNAMGGCGKGAMGGCGKGAMGGCKMEGKSPKASCESSTITLVLPCGHDIKVVVGDGKPAAMGGCHKGGMGGCRKEGMGGCRKEGMGGCSKEGMGGCHKGGMGGCQKGGMGGCHKQTQKEAEAPAAK